MGFYRAVTKLSDIITSHLFSNNNIGLKCSIEENKKSCDSPKTLLNLLFVSCSRSTTLTQLVIRHNTHPLSLDIFFFRSSASRQVQMSNDSTLLDVVPFPCVSRIRPPSSSP